MDPEVSGRGLCRHCVMNEEAVMLLKNERMRTKHLSPNVGFLLENSNDIHNLDEIAPIEYECEKSLSTTICETERLHEGVTL